MTVNRALVGRALASTRSGGGRVLIREAPGALRRSRKAAAAGAMRLSRTSSPHARRSRATKPRRRPRPPRPSSRPGPSRPPSPKPPQARYARRPALSPQPTEKPRPPARSNPSPIPPPRAPETVAGRALRVRQVGRVLRVRQVRSRFTPDTRGARRSSAFAKSRGRRRERPRGAHPATTRAGAALRTAGAVTVNRAQVGRVLRVRQVRSRLRPDTRGARRYSDPVPSTIVAGSSVTPHPAA